MTRNTQKFGSVASGTEDYLFESHQGVRFKKVYTYIVNFVI
jgi:hypothetical protein